MEYDFAAMFPGFPIAYSILIMFVQLDHTRFLVWLTYFICQAIYYKKDWQIGIIDGSAKLRNRPTYNDQPANLSVYAQIDEQFLWTQINTDFTDFAGNLNPICVNL